MLINEVLEKIMCCNLETIQNTTFLEPLTDEQNSKFVEIIQIILVHLSKSDETRITLSFRGENHENLKSKLSREKNDMSEVMLTSLLFYFGDKAKHYYKIKESEVKKYRWIKNIEDYDQDTFNTIFKKIKDVLKSSKKEILEFNKNQPEFIKFFKEDNQEQFTSKLLYGDNLARDYYLYFLHTSGKIGIGEKSLFVSTSLSYDIAVKFSGEEGKRYVIYYLVPEPFENFAVSYMRAKHYEPWLKENGLPIYNGNAIYPLQHEVAVKGALFSHFILGIKMIGEDRFLANPHLFNERNSNEAILGGLYIDQRDFENRLHETKYIRGVCTYFDGIYQTIGNT